MLIASPDLVALVRSQISLLTQSLGAGSSVMYLAEELTPGVPPNLFEVAAYPEDADRRLSFDLGLAQGLDRGLDRGFEQGPNQSFPRGIDSPLALPPSDRQSLTKSSRLVIPLIFEQQILGFLMTGRDDRQWTETEQSQIQQVANTLAIACGIERRSQWQEMQQQNFIASLLHQLRNPLTAIRTFSQLIRRKLLPDDPNQTFVTGILRETIHLQELLQSAEPNNAMLEEASSNASPLLLTGAMELLPLDLGELIEPLISSAAAIATERRLKFSTKIPKYLPLVLANRNALREVVANLLDNALKYTPAPGEVNLEIQVQAIHLEIQLSDTGCGIPASDLDHLFKRHFRGRQAEGKIGGTGLGLAIAKDLIDKMQGEIKVSSKLNRGSTFIIKLRISPPAQIEPTVPKMLGTEKC
jgi:signal transduction histidine kinase